jgi:hypothetical protein
VQGAGGAAAIAWQGGLGAETHLVTRAAGGPFAPAVVVTTTPPVPGRYDPFYLSESYLRAAGGDLGAILLSVNDISTSVALTGDGRAVLATVDVDAPLQGRAQLTAVPLSGGAPASSQTRMFAADSVRALPLILADGTPAVVWVEGAGGDLDSFDPGPFRLRMAAENVVAHIDAPPTPRVSVGAPLRRTVRGDGPLRLPVRCSAACDVTVTAERQIGALTVSDAVHLRKAGRATLALEAAGYLARRTPTAVRLRVVYGARGALYPKQRRLTVRYARSGPGLPRIAKVRARRDGKRVRVEVAVSGDTRELPLFVSGDDTAGFNGEPLVTRFVEVKKDGTARLSLPAREGMRYVAARLPIFLGPGSKKVARVR